MYRKRLWKNILITRLTFVDVPVCAIRLELSGNNLSVVTTRLLPILKSSSRRVIDPTQTFLGRTLRYFFACFVCRRAGLGVQPGTIFFITKLITAQLRPVTRLRFGVRPTRILLPSTDRPTDYTVIVTVTGTRDAHRVGNTTGCRWNINATAGHRACTAINVARIVSGAGMWDGETPSLGLSAARRVALRLRRRKRHESARGVKRFSARTDATPLSARHRL